MARFQPGHKLAKGRPPGAKNKATIARDFIESFSEFSKSPEYEDSWRRRVLSGRAPHLETYGLKQIYGDRRDVNVSGDLVLRWQSE